MSRQHRTVSAAYESLERRWDRGDVVVLDGGMGSELERVGYPSERNIDLLWGTRALYEAPELTKEVHRRYVRAGADVLTTNTWRIDGIPEAKRRGRHTRLPLGVYPNLGPGSTPGGSSTTPRRRSRSSPRLCAGATKRGRASSAGAAARLRSTSRRS